MPQPTTHADIRAACEAIQATWTAETERARRGEERKPLPLELRPVAFGEQSGRAGGPRE